MSLRRLVRRPPPRLFAQKKTGVSHLSSQGSGVGIGDLNASECVDQMTLRAENTQFSNRVKANPNNLPEHFGESRALLERAIELVPDMDPILIVRLLAKTRKLDGISNAEMSNLLNAIEPRIQELSAQQLTRLMFHVAHSRNQISPDSHLARVLLERAHVIFSNYSICPPRVVAKLAVSISLLDGDKRHSKLMIKIQELALASLSHMDPEHVQQVAFSIGRYGSCENTELVSQLTARAVTLSPVKPVTTYCSLLISLSRLERPYEDQHWKIFKRIYVDHIGLGSEKEPHISTLKQLLKLNEIQLRRIRNALVW